jgi:RNA polymerase sigma-70 factor (ECF subfamily)
VRAGHPGAFDRLVQAYSARIYTHLYRLVRNREEAEDLTQEAFIRAYRFLHQYDGRRPFRNWLYTIASHVGLNALRSRQRRGRYECNDVDDHAAASAPSADSPLRDAVRQELRDLLLGAVESLPPQAAMLMHLVYFEGMPVQEAAEILGMSEANAKVTLHRARRRLREQLVDRDDT